MLSVAAHYGWLQTNRVWVEPQPSGGQNAPLAINFSMAKEQAKPSVQSKPRVKERIEKTREAVLKDAVLDEPMKEVAKKAVKHKFEDRRISSVPVFEDGAVEKSETVDEVLNTVRSTVVELDQDNETSFPVVKQARFRQPPQPPVYPALALQRRQEGSALIRALVDGQGETEKVELVRSSGFSVLDSAALAAVEGWSFSSAKVDGVAMKAWVEVPVAFQINL